MLKQDVDIRLARFLSQEMKEDSKRQELTALLDGVDALEAEVGQFVPAARCMRLVSTDSRHFESRPRKHDTMIECLVQRELRC